MSFRVNKHHWTCGWDFGKTNHYHNFHVKIYYEKGWIISPFHYCIFTRGTNYQWSRLWFFFLFQPNLETDFPIHILIFNQKFQIRLQKDFEPNIYASNDLNVFATFAKLSLFQTLFYVCVKQWSNLVAFSAVLFAPFRRACSTVQWRSNNWLNLFK